MTEFKKTNWWVSLFGRHNKALDSAEVLNYNSNMKNYSYIKHFSVVLNLIQHLKHKRFRNKFGMICGTICHPELVSVSKLKSFKAFQKLAAFTLAEVLITLAIVGIVAAMTIPTLLANYQNKTWDTASSVFEKKLSEALKVMNSQFSLSGYSTTESFVDELSKHFKIINICKNDSLTNCFGPSLLGVASAIDVATGIAQADDKGAFDISGLKTAKDLGQQEWNTNTVGVQFANGTTAILAYNDNNCKQDPYSNKISGLDCIAILYDTSGFKSPNENNKDVRMINVNIEGVCAFKVDGVCMGRPIKIDSYLNVAECEQLRSEGYQIDQCYARADYWAYAVKTCGGVDKVINMAQIRKLGYYLYDGGSLNVYDGSVVWNRSKIEKFFGVGELNSSQIVILSNLEQAPRRPGSGIGGGAAVYIYSPNQWVNGERWGRYINTPVSSNNFYTVCVLD